MTTYDRGAIRRALAAKLATVSGIRRVEPYITETISETPCIYLATSDPIELNATFGRGKVLTSFTAVIVLGRVDSEQSQQVMDQLVSDLPIDVGSPTTLRQAAQSDQTLGGLCSTVLVRRYDNIRAVEIGGNEYLAIDAIIEIRT